MAAKQKRLSVTSTRAILPLPSSGVRVGVDELNPADPNGVIATWLTALKTLKANNDFEDEMSYFRLAAIHGAPYVGWDGIKSDGALEANGNFCRHGQNTFPTWHRVYMILFENALYNVIPDTDTNKASFRIPYWDWAKNDQGSADTPLPLLLESQFWPVGSATENPLWRFVNPQVYNAGTVASPDLQPYPFGDVEMGQYVIGNDQISNGLTSLWSVTTSTSRCVPPNSQDFVNGNNKMDVLMTNFKTAGWYNNPATGDTPPYTTISDYVYGLLSWEYDSFNSFATTAYDPVPGTNKYGWLSLEYLHNNLHNWIGGSSDSQIGHMNDVPVAAYDPIFWLHHSFIDALFAAWQSLPQNKNLWLDDNSAVGPLEPFHTNTNSTFFTSNDVQQISDWNYSYSAFPTKSGSKEDLIKMINRKYGNGMQRVIGRAIKEKIPGAKNDYIINVLYNRHALDQAYKIHFFLGDIDANIADSNLMAHANHVGCIYTFSNSGRSRCSNCSNQKALNKLSRAQIFLTVPLIYRQRNGLLAHLNPEGGNGVQEYLKRNLTWKVVKRDGTDVPVKDNPKLSDLKIIFAQGKADHFPEDDTKLSVFHGDSYKTFWQGSYPGQDSESPERYIIKN